MSGESPRASLGPPRTGPPPINDQYSPVGPQRQGRGPFGTAARTKEPAARERFPARDYGADATSTEARNDMRESDAAMSSAFDFERMRASRTW
jgi:hypothetical protein